MSSSATLHKTLHRSGSTIHYWLSGPDDGPLVAFTHGASMDHRMFDKQAPAAASAGYRVLTWDVRGHGLSKPVGEDFTVPSTADDLLALMDILGYEKAVLVGQSFGGYVGQELLFRYPERVEALVVIGSTNITALPSKLEYWALRLSPIMLRLWPDGNLRKLIARSTTLKPEVQSYAYEATRMLSKGEFMTVWKAVANTLHEEPDYRIECPLLLTHGEHDRAGTVAKEAPGWAKREPDCHYKVIPEASHNANQDNPEFFNWVLLDFLDQRTPTGSESR